MTVEQSDWNRAGEFVSVAVIDKGFWFDEYPNGTIKHHDDLSENIIGAYNFRYNQGIVEIVPLSLLFLNPNEEEQSHGTHCAGIIGAVDNEIGVIGTAPKVGMYLLQLNGHHGIPN